MTKTTTINSRATWAGVKNDYVLSYEGHVIGRIRLAEAAWEWHINAPLAMPLWASGSAASLDECRTAFGMAWGRLLKETNPERLERAWELEAAAQSRLDRLETAREGSSTTNDEGSV
jgi:hypothetical protein